MDVLLARDVLPSLKELCGHSYGSYVVRHLLEYGSPAHAKRVVQALLDGGVHDYASQRLGSHVVEAALRSRSALDEDKLRLAAALCGDDDYLVHLATNQFGRHVVSLLADAKSEMITRPTTVAALQRVEYRLSSSRYGKGVLKCL